jgi:hypothetical protein
MTVVVLALVLTACGGGGKKSGSGKYGSDLLTGETSTVPPDQQTTPATTPDGKKLTVTTVRPAPGRTVPTAPPDTRDPIVVASHGPVGDFAPIMLSKNSPAKKIIYEVMPQDGTTVPSRPLNHVISELRKYSGKPVTVETTPIPAGPPTWSDTVINNYGDRYSRFKQGGDTAVFHALFVHGSSQDSDQVLGQAVRADTLIMYYDHYKNPPSARISADDVTDTVVTHETGHVLGLVDEYLNRGRGDYKDDPAPGGHHSPNKKSVMYWAVESSGFLFSNFDSPPPTQFDAEDQADLTSIHNGAAKGSKG